MSIISEAFGNIESGYLKSINDVPDQRSAPESYSDYEYASGVTSNVRYIREENSPIRFTEKEAVPRAIDVVPYIPNKTTWFNGDFTLVTSAPNSLKGTCQREPGVITYRLYVEEGYITDVEEEKYFCSRLEVGATTTECECDNLINTPTYATEMGQSIIRKCDGGYEPWAGGADECFLYPLQCDDGFPGYCCQCDCLGLYGEYYCSKTLLGFTPPCAHATGEPATTRFAGGYHSGIGLPFNMSGDASPETCTSNFGTCCDCSCP
jgi:hypothetical protein